MYDSVTTRLKKIFFHEKKHNIWKSQVQFAKTRGSGVGRYFIASLHALAEHCQYGALKEELIQDRIAVGLRDADILEKIQLDPELTQKETVHEQQAIARSQVLTENKIDSVKQKKKRSKSVAYQRNKSQYRAKPKPVKCIRCGAEPAHGWDSCPRRNRDAGDAESKHWVWCCLSKNNVHEVDDREEETDVYLGTTDCAFLEQ